MAVRRVRKTEKASDGDIQALCWQDSSEKWWKTSKAVAIRQIEGHQHEYYVVGANRSRVNVITVPDGAGGKYLRTEADSRTSNNLGELDDC